MFTSARCYLGITPHLLNPILFRDHPIGHPGRFFKMDRNIRPSHHSIYVSSHKKKFFIWLEHSAVCETEEELDAFIKQVNEEHQVELAHKKSSPTVM